MNPQPKLISNVPQLSERPGTLTSGSYALLLHFATYGEEFFFLRKKAQRTSSAYFEQMCPHNIIDFLCEIPFAFLYVYERLEPMSDFIG